MKTTNNQAQTQNTRTHTSKRSPEIRDNLDSRKNEEQESKGDDITHNQKAHHNNLKNKNTKK
ncbi:MAG: hypothetical protein EOO01_12455 [Chitinophagaceae bacterium]|nr:MAG: hypothetical protein EOO01_12455 [Chitinophagaceae bacterium]